MRAVDAVARTLQSLTPDELALLLRLNEMTPPKYRRQERDDRPGEDVGQEAGLSTVGVPTGTRVPMAFKALAEAGYVERVKGDGSGPIRYRITQLGERELLSDSVRYLRRELDETIEKWNQDHARQAGEISRLKGELARALPRLAEYERPLWRKLLRRPPRED